MSITLTVTDMRPGLPPVTLTITGTFPTLTSLKEAIYMKTEVEPEEQLLLQGDRLLFGGADICSRFNLWGFPALSLYHRLPGNQQINVNILYRRLPVLSYNVRADYPVGKLKLFLARKYSMAPWKQVLMTLKAPMLEAEPLSSYATRTRVEISLCEYTDGRLPELLRIFVVDEDTMVGRRILVERRDTPDVLLGYLERTGVVAPQDRVLFRIGDEMLDNIKSFEDQNIGDHDPITLLMKKN